MKLTLEMARIIMGLVKTNNLRPIGQLARLMGTEKNKLLSSSMRYVKHAKKKGWGHKPIIHKKISQARQKAEGYKGFLQSHGSHYEDSIFKDTYKEGYSLFDKIVRNSHFNNLHRSPLVLQRELAPGITKVGSNARREFTDIIKRRVDFDSKAFKANNAERVRQAMVIKQEQAQSLRKARRLANEEKRAKSRRDWFLKHTPYREWSRG